MTNTPENKSKVSTGQKLAWGFGGWAENLSMNVIPSLSYNIFQIGMGISPLVIGIAMGASKIIEGITDPLIGNMSDNTHSRWGRRRPWIFVGAFVIALMLISVFYTPRSVKDVIFLGMAIKGSFIQGAYFITTVSLFFMTFAIWQIPFSALGLELEEDYNERSKLQSFKLVFSYIIGTAIGSLYLLTQMRDVWGGDEVTGARYLGIILGAIIFISAIIPSLLCRERYAIKAHEKIKFWPSFFETFKDQPFRLLMGAIFFIFLSLFFMLPILGYISMYHVCNDGMQNILSWSWRHPFEFHFVEKFLTHKGLAGTLGAFAAVIQTTTQILTIFLINSVNNKFDKKTILMAGLVVAIIGYFSSWFMFSPTSPYLSIWPPIIINIGLCACWVLIGSFSADICDYDELKTGKRREGMFSAVTGFLIKLSIAFVIFLSSWILIKLGIEGANPILSIDQLITLRTFYIIVPVLALIIAIVFMIKYPLSKAKVVEIQDQLKINRA